VHTFGYRAKAPEEPEIGTSFEVFEPLNRFLEAYQEDPLYLTLDLDVLDPSVFPAVTNPEPLGITLWELFDTLHLLDGRLLAADIVEYNPGSCADLHPAVTAAFLLRELSFCFPDS
jgi:arginase family enzyme